MDSWTANKISGVAGVLFGVGVAVFLFGLQFDSPSVGDPVADIREWFDDNGSRYFISSWFGTFFFLAALLVFASGLSTALTRADQDRPLARLAFGSAIATVAMGGVGTLFWSVLALNGTQAYSDEIVRLAMDLDALAFGFVMAWGLAVFVGASSLLILRNGVVWTGLGWAGAVIALAIVVGTLWVLDGDPESGIGALMWIGITAVLIWSLLAGISLFRAEEQVPSAA